MPNTTQPTPDATLADVHPGDLVQLAACIRMGGGTCPPGQCTHGWRPAVRVLTDPAPCGCQASGCLRCRAVTAEGRKVPVHASLTRPVRVVEHGPAALAGATLRPHHPRHLDHGDTS